MNVTEPLRRQAWLTPDAVAVIRADDGAVSYGALNGSVDRAAAALKAAGIEPGQIVGLGMTGPDEFPGVVAALALARMGVASADLSHAGVAACIVEPGGRAPAGVRAIGYEELVGAGREAPAMHAGGEAGFRVFGTSGTTGTPKHVVVSHAMMARRVTAYWLAAGARRDVYICAMPLGTASGCNALLRTLWGGGTFVLTNPARAVTAMRRHQVTGMMIAPGSLAQIVAGLPAGTQATQTPSLRTVDVTGSLMPGPVQALVRERLCREIVCHYGSMEAGPVAVGPLRAGADTRAVGWLVPGVEVQVVDGDGRAVAAGEEGVIRVRGAQMGTEYVGDAAATAAAFRDGWFELGDIGTVSARGMVTMTGRSSEIINVGGVKVSPHVVEDLLLAVPGVTEAVAFGVPDRVGLVQVWAAVVAGRVVPVAELTAACAGMGPGTPKFIIQMKGLPRNANGKVMKDVLVKFAVERQV